jgi:hypothetical protein
LTEAPKLLVEWSSPWEEFRSAIRPALAKSSDRLAGEAHSGLFPLRGMLLSCAVQALLLIAVIVIPAQLSSMRPYQPPVTPKYDVIYYSKDELPRTQDVGGAQSGVSGEAGGQEALHRTQTIRVARGNSLRDSVLDAPQLKLPVSNAAVANLLAYQKIPGPPPAEGLSSSLRAPALNREAVPPPPSWQRDSFQSAPAIGNTLVAPAPDVRRDAMQAAPALGTQQVVAPSVNAPAREMAALQIPGSRPADVVPPPVSALERDSNFNSRLSLPAAPVVAPAPSVSREVAALGPGFGPGTVEKQVVPPPVALGTANGTNRMSGGLGGTAVVPPPVQLGIPGGQARGGGTGSGFSGGLDAVAPAPSMGNGAEIGGTGRGSRGAGLGGAFDSGSMVAPPKSGGSGNGTGVVLSNKPGDAPGVPSNGGAGALAMSPAGGNQPGLGGSGGGTGIGHGAGPGSGFSGSGAGAGKEGSGRGSDPNARGGISPYPGPGGAGKAASGKPPLPGVSVEGGSQKIVNLPSFGSDGGASSTAGHSSVNEEKGPGITVVATSRSGGAFNFYGTLKGDRVYTTYFETALGTAVMQYADPESSAHPYAEALKSPTPIRADVPEGLPKSRLVIACILDRSGAVRNPHVLEPGSALMTSKVLASLNHWKFRPVRRGEQPVEVNAILGFNIDTNDRF